MPANQYVNFPMIKRRALLAFSFLIALEFTPAKTKCQQPVLKFKRIGLEQGLSNSTIETIFQDKRGFLWFGTRDGLNRYDGSRMVVFKPEANNPAAITDGYINCIFEDSRSHLWVGTSNGLNRYDPEKNIFSHFKNNRANNQSLSHNAVTAVEEDSYGNIWVSTNGGGINKFDEKTGQFTRYLHKPNQPGGPASNNVLCIFKDRHGGMWVGCDNGIEQFIPETGSFKNIDILDQFKDKSHPFSTVTIKEDNTGNILIGISGNGLVIYNYKLNSVKHYIHSDADPYSLATNLVRSVCVGANGSIWVGVINGGLNLLDPVSEKFYNYQNEPDDAASLSQRTVSALFEDKQGSLWVGTHRGGINLFSPNSVKFKSYRQSPYKNSLSHNDVKTFCEDKSGNIWIGTDGGGLNLFDRKTNQFTHFKFDPVNSSSLGSNEVLAIMEDSEGLLWVGTWGGGLCLYNNSTKSFKRFRNQPGNNLSISSDYIQKMFEDSKKNIWVATYFGGLNLLDKKTGQFIRVQKSKTGHTQLSGNNILSICEDAEGNLWLGTDDGGLNKLIAATGEFEHFFSNSEKKPDIRVLFTDSKGRLWAGQYGLYVYNKAANQFSLFTSQSGLTSEFIKGIAEDNNGNLWVSTSKGITQLNPETKSAKKYNVSDGLQGLEFEANAYLKTKDGQMLFGGLNGFNLFSPDDIVPNHFIPPVVVTGFMLQDKHIKPGDGSNLLSKDVSLTSSISLSHLQTSFAFEFAAFNYTASDNNRFKYKLENWDKDWVDAGTDRRATYINVSPGSYTFTVKASNNDGLWNETGYSINVVIRPPFWQTWWFRLLIAAAVVSGAVYFYRIRKKIQLQKFEEAKKEEIHQLQLQFFTNISHEFRTPLSLITGPVEKLLKENPPEKNKHTYQVIQRNANRLLQLINELMDFRKAESGALKLQVMPCNLTSFLDEIAEEFSELALQKKINFSINDLHAKNGVWLDRQITEKIIINLLSNSFKYTPDGGKICLRVVDSINPAAPSFENKLIIENDYKGGQMIYFCVTDNGIGISKESIRHLFERYYRVSDTHLGSGIGLAFVKNLAQLHKGSIYVYSERNKGTGIIIGIPCSEQDYSNKEKWVHKNEQSIALESLKPLQEDNTAAEKAKDESPAEKKPCTILLAEDNEELRLFLKDSLAEGYNIIEAADGKAALQTTQEIYPDIIVSDVMMPVMDGNEFCKQIKSNPETAHVPFIMLTAKSGMESHLEGVTAGADFYFSKPVNIEFLQITLKNITAQKNRLREKYQRDYSAGVKELVNNTKDKEFLEELIKIIEDNLQRPEMDIEFVCMKIGMSRTKLFNKLKNITGQSISDFVRTVRLRKAAQLLAHQDISITEAMYSVGIQTQSYFTRAFKNEFGKTPTQFLKEIEPK